MNGTCFIKSNKKAAHEGRREGKTMKYLIISASAAIMFVLQITMAMLYASRIRNERKRKCLLWIDGIILSVGVLALMILFPIALKAA